MTKKKTATKSVPKKPRDEHPQFAAFWSIYPRCLSRAKAAESFQRAINRGHSAETILAGVRNYAFSPDPQFIPHPTTFLNQDRFLGVTYHAPQTVIAKATKLSWRDAYDGGAEILPGPARYGASPTPGPIIEGDLTDGG